MAKAKQIDDATRDILARATIDGTVLRLPEQLQRDAYQRVAKVLEGLGGKWDRKVQGHRFPFDPSRLLNAAANDGSFVDRKQSLQLFETPAGLAARMVALAGVLAHEQVLEPSAGLGAIVLPLLATGALVTAVELDDANCRVLRDRTGVVAQMADFDTWSRRCSILFDVVVMNPPFRQNQDIRHIQAAWTLLKPGGRLVAISSAHWSFGAEAEAAAFRRWIDVVQAHCEELPRGTFPDTTVSSFLIQATKAA